jgi:flagellin-specific chaperone FliS
MEKEELIKHGVIGGRLAIAEFIKTKLYDIFVILLIIIYTLLIFVYFGLDGTTYETNNKLNDTLYVIELVILAFFVIDISLHIGAFHCLYLRDGWNIFDMVVIALSIVFVILDMNVKNKTVQNILKIRGIFRLLRIFILIRKLNLLRIKRDIQKKKKISGTIDLRSPLERVLEILNELINKLDSNAGREIEDINYCIKMISSNKLYEANIDMELGEYGEKKSINKEVIMLFNQYSQQSPNKQPDGSPTKKRTSKTMSI